MKLLSYPKKLWFIFLFSFLFFPTTIFAQLVPCGGDGQPTCQLCHVFVLFDGIIRFVMFTIVPPIAVLMLIAGGIFFYFSAGDPEKTSTAIRLIKSTIIGMLIVYLAWGFIIAIFTAVGAASWDSWYYNFYPDCPR